MGQPSQRRGLGRSLPRSRADHAREVRNAIAYVLLNFHKHLRAPPGIDPLSSGPWFEGWARPPATRPHPCPVAPAQTWLAAVGWLRAGGPIDLRDAPSRKESGDPIGNRTRDCAVRERRPNR